MRPVARLNPQMLGVEIEKHQPPSTAELRGEGRDTIETPEPCEDDGHVDSPIGLPIEGTKPDRVALTATPSPVAIARLLKRVTCAVDELRDAAESGALADGPERSDAWHVYNLARILRQTIADRATRVPS